MLWLGSWMQYSFDFGKAFEEDLKRHRLFERHESSVAGMSSVMLSNGWIELENDPKEESLGEEFERLLDGSECEGGVDEQLNPSVLQFFYDIFNLSIPYPDMPYSDMLVSFLNDEDDDGAQEYQIYSGDGVADVMNFLSSIKNSPALVFTGRFRDMYNRGEPTPNTRAENQRTVSAICVDVDPPADEDGGDKLPIEPSVVSHIMENLPDELTPSYISLTGNGVHFWYVFDKAIQIFTNNSKRREKMRSLANTLYGYYGKLLEGQPAYVDYVCAALNRGFRAPGSTTKYHDRVVSYTLPVRKLHDPIAIARFLDASPDIEYYGGECLSEEDVRYRTTVECDEIKERVKRDFPATESQLELIRDLHDQNLVTNSEFDKASGMSVGQAGQLIGTALERRVEAGSSVLPRRPGWKVSPHRLVAGKTGGVYQTIYSQITKVAVGTRYNALYMLAGVAYMMTAPAKTLDELREDYYALLETPWAKAGHPSLSAKDIDNALMGYKAENWQTVQSEIRVLGFNPFNPPAKRNGRSQEEHLKDYIPLKSYEEKVEKIAGYLAENPGCTISECARNVGICRQTVSKYWPFACEMANVEDIRTGNHSPS